MIGRRATVGIVVAALAAAGLGFFYGWQRLAPVAPAAGPNLLYAQTWPDSAGRPIALETYRGKALVVNFWATWCPPCVEEIPEFSRLSAEFSGIGIYFVGIAIDNAANVVEFSKRVPAAYPSVIAGPAAIELARVLGNQAGGLPYTLVIDRQGTIRAQHLGRMREAELRAILTGLDAPTASDTPKKS